MTDRTTRSLDQLAAIDAWCDSFESDWQAGGADLAHAISRITEQQLAAVQVTRREVLEELIKIDLEYRWRRATVPLDTDQRHEDDTVGSPGKTRWELPKIEFYWGQFPELRSDEKIPEELICEEYRVRRQWGDRPPREEFFKRFSSQREQLTPLLDQIDLQLGEVATAPFPRQLHCPNCHNPFPINDEDASNQVTCSQCGQEIQLVASVSSRRMEAQTLGHFKLLEKLGSGAFGVVWKATDLKLDRIVALKVARQSQLAGGDADAFLREARAAAQLNHPNIVSVYEAGQEGSTVYLVCDYVDGLTLGEWAIDRQPTFRESAQLCQQIAIALQHAHEAGVIHRDLKPGNIMMDTEHQPHLMDFGLARREASEVTMTVEGQILGTPAYMSPEQAQGEGHKADRRTDIYSLGVVFYELLTGVRPFQGNVRMLLKQVAEDGPPRPSKFVDRLPKDLETICLKCLEKSPARRFQSATQLSQELGRFLGGEPLVCRPVSRLERAARWCKRNPLAASIAILLILLVCASLAAGYQGLMAVAARQETLQARVDALWGAEMSAVPALLQSLDETAATQQALHLALDTAEEEGNSSRVLRARMALARTDPSQSEPLAQLLRSCDVKELPPLVSSLAPYAGSDLADRFWLELNSPGLDDAALLRLAAALVAWDSNPTHWNDELTNRLVTALLQESVADLIAVWRQLFAPLGENLTAHLGSTYVANEDGETRDKIMYVLEHALDDAAKRPLISAADLARLAGHVERRHYASLRELAQIHCGENIEALVQATIRQIDGSLPNPNSELSVAKAIIFVADLGRLDYLWQHLRLDANLDVRSFLISELRPEVVDLDVLASQLVSDTEVSTRRAILLAMGHYPPTTLPARPDVKATVADIYQTDPDPGIHSAAFWALRQWRATVPETGTRPPSGERPGWYVNGQGQVLVMLPAGEFSMGSPTHERGRRTHEMLQTAKIPRDFAISATEVTVEQFLRFDPEHEYDKLWTPTSSCPVGRINLKSAAAYCNWLSEKEGLPESEWCFPANRDATMTADYRSSDYLTRRGYRLPTSAEWEYACRAGTSTSRFFGEEDALIGKYAWYHENAQGVSHPVASLLPNDWGLFDVYGNARERTIDTMRVRGDLVDVLRGETVEDWPVNLRSAFLNVVPREGPGSQSTAAGFRVARTLDSVSQP